MSGDRIELEKVRGAGRGADVVRRLETAPGWSGMSTDDLMALTRSR